VTTATPSADEQEQPKYDTRSDPRSTEALIDLALTEADEHATWDAVTVLHFRATREVLEAALRLCKSESADERVLGANILGQLGIPDRAFPGESVSTLLGILESEQDPDVLQAACVALGHQGDTAAIGPLIKFKDHASEDVRHGVAFGLLGHRDAHAVEALIELSGDDDSDVRDWATFGLGAILEDVDTPQLRDALFARLDDPDDDTRGEALSGLSRRKDARVLAPLMRELEDAAGDAGPLLFEAAAELADPRLCPVLLKIRALGVEGSYLADALIACDCENSHT